MKRELKEEEVRGYIFFPWTHTYISAYKERKACAHTHRQERKRRTSKTTCPPLIGDLDGDTFAHNASWPTRGPGDTSTPTTQGVGKNHRQRYSDPLLAWNCRLLFPLLPVPWTAEADP